MLSYENGVLVALLIWAYHMVMTLILINSKFERNLNKIGLRLSWYVLNIKPMSANDKNASILKKIGKFLLIAAMGFIGIFFSWVTVAWQIGAFLYLRNKNSGEPQSVREFKWHLKNRELTFDQVLREFMKAGGEENQDYETFRANVISDMESNGLT